MPAEARRPCLGVCVRNGVAALALLGPNGLRVFTTRLRQWPAGERVGRLQYAVRCAIGDPYGTLVVVEQRSGLAASLLGHAHAVHALSLAQVARRLLKAEPTASQRRLCQRLVELLPAAGAHVRTLGASGKIARMEARELVRPLAIALALTGLRLLASRESTTH